MSVQQRPRRFGNALGRLSNPSTALVAFVCALCLALLAVIGPPVGTAQAETLASQTSDTFFGGYRTNEAHMAHLDAVQTTYPDLAAVFDYGDSWLKVQGRPGGNDLKVICLTNMQPGDCVLDADSNKPRALVMSAIHGNELATPEIAWRLIDDLTMNYGTDAEITHILDTTEVWVIPVANPDGFEMNVSEGGIGQRKNANDSAGILCEGLGQYHGVDLNRNASYDWDPPSSASDRPCDSHYRGASAASEPEQVALEPLYTDLWLDQKPASPEAAALPGATGVFLSLHSDGELIFFPNQPDRTSRVPDDAALRAFASRMGHLNGYAVGATADMLGAKSGSTDEHTYGELGVASFTFELSPTITVGTCAGQAPDYSCIDGSLWPQNREALLYALKVTGAPYTTPHGPTTTVEPVVVSATTFEVSATVDDDAFTDRVRDRPAVQAIVAAEYSIDTAPDQGGDTFALTPVDGSFDSATEAVQASVSTAALAEGVHTIYVRGRDASGHWGPIDATTFTVTAPRLESPGRSQPPRALGGGLALFTWDVVAGVDRYLLSWTIDGVASDDNITESSRGYTYLSDPSHYGKELCGSVVSKSRTVGIGNSLPTELGCVTVVAPPAPLPSPRVRKAPSLNQNDVLRFFFGSVDGASSYRFSWTVDGVERDDIVRAPNFMNVPVPGRTRLFGKEVCGSVVATSNSTTTRDSLPRDLGCFLIEASGVTPVTALPSPSARKAPSLNQNDVLRFFWGSVDDASGYVLSWTVNGVERDDIVRAPNFVNAPVPGRTRLFGKEVCASVVATSDTPGVSDSLPTDLGCIIPE